MTVIELLSQVGSHGIRLRLDGQSLRYEGSRQALPPDLLEELRKHRDEIVRFLRSTASAKTNAAIPKAQSDTSFPVSPAQRRFYFLDRLEGPGSSYSLASAFMIEGPLHVPALAKSIADIVARHEILRTRFASAGPAIVQLVTDWTPSLHFVDLAGLPNHKRSAALDKIIEQEAARPFNIPDGPHIRTALVRLDADTHALLVNMHHIVSDDRSTAVFVRELYSAYDARCAGRTPRFPPLRIQYKDVAHWLAANSQSTEGQLDYWRRTLAGAPPLLQLPIDKPRPPVQTFRGDSICVNLGRNLQKSVESLRERLALTPFHCFHAGFAALLYKYSGQEDLVIGVPVANRDHKDLESLIGPFINVVALRTRCHDALTLHGLLDQVRWTMVGAADQAGVPFEEVVNALAPERSASYAPLFNVLFAFEDTPVGILNLPGLKTRTLNVKLQSAKYDLALVVQADAGGLNLCFKYNVDLFHRATVERLAHHYLTLLQAMAEDPERTLGDLCLLTSAQWQEQVVDWNRTERAYPHGIPVHELFERTARAMPDAVALDFEGQSLSYWETNLRANRLAHYLRALGAGPESIVAIRAERCLEMVIAVLGVLKAGAAYLPVDPEYPMERQKFMLEDASATILLTLRNLPPPPSGGGKIVFLDEIVANQNLALVESDPEPSAGPTNASCLIYTSGSTGKPKAVISEHRAMANNLFWMQDKWLIGPQDVFLLKAAFSFDVSFKEILWPLMFGARLVIARPGGQHDPAYLQAVIQQNRVSVIHLVPTMLDYFLREGYAGDSLRIVMCGGEALTVDLQRRFGRKYGAGLLHLYGPTEAAIAVTGILYKKDDSPSAITLGRAMSNCEIYILDSGLNPAPVGAPGELFIGGMPLARGYHNRPDLTAEKFVPDGFSGRLGARLYRTGDIARYLSDGDIQFLGRLDHQVKLRGLRLELGEIENALRQHPDVLDALVTVHQDDAGIARLAAYVAPFANARPAARELARFLRGQVPGYMAPAAYLFLDTFPALPNGKVDRSALPRPVFANQAESRNGRPASHIEERLAALWKEVLSLRDVGLHDHFFDIGGHSILLLRLHERMCQEFDREVAVTDLFLNPTIAEMAALLSDEQEAATKASKPVPAPRSNNGGAIAIIGIAGRFPGAKDLEEFWQNISAGAESIRRFSGEELLAEGFEPDVVRHPNFIKARGYVEGLDLFDNAFFRYTASESTTLDPQFRVLLECAQQAFDYAGYDPDALASDRKYVGSYVSVSRSSYYLNNIQTHPELTEDVGGTRLAIATDKGFAATHLSYRLNLRGPAMTIDTACSSSLVAVHQACAGLLGHECDLALAGGVSVEAPLKGGYVFQEGGIGSPDGHCRPFDRRAGGTVRGSGGGLVLLKRLSDAIADGDFIHAVIRGTAINNDGSAKIGFTAPSESGQTEVIDRALRAAGVEPDEIDYVETHGTGTKLGDPIEFAALRQVFRNGRVALGALKANIGHLDTAAGIAGLVKTILAIQHKEIPPLANFEEPNEAIQLAGAPFRIPRKPESWPETGRPRRAGVSSFGIGGTNAHVVLEEAPPRGAFANGEGCELLCLSAMTGEALVSLAGNLARHIGRQSPSLGEVVFSMNKRRAYSFRRAVICNSVSELTAALRRIGDAALPSGLKTSGSTCPVWFVFPECSGAPAYLCDLYAHYSRFRNHVEQSLLALDAGLRSPILGLFRRELSSAPLGAAEAASVLGSHALAACIGDLGVNVDVVTGAGLGELAAAAVAEVLPIHRLMHLAVLASQWKSASSSAERAFVLGEFTRQLSAHALQKPKMRLVSATLGEEQCDPANLLGAVTRNTSHATPPPENAIALHIGPAGPNPSGTVENAANEEAISVHLPGAAELLVDESALHRAAGRLWEEGARIDWDRYFRRRGDPLAAGYRRAPLPSYPFERKRFWIDRIPPASARPDSSPRSTECFGVTGWIRESIAIEPYTTLSWLVFTDDSPLAANVIKALMEGGHVVTVVGLPDAGVLAPLFDSLRLKGALPSRCIDFRSGSAALQSLEQQGWSGRVGTIVKSAFSVTGSEVLNPEHALLAITRETHGVAGGLQSTTIDVGSDTAPQSLPLRVVRELAASVRIPTVAYRGPHRWVPARQDVALREFARPQRVPGGKTHLIVEGLTDFGLTLAEQLASSGVDHLVIVHSDPFPAKHQWPNGFDTRISGDPRARRMTRLRKIIESGVELTLFQLDLGGEKAEHGLMELQVELREKSTSIHAIYHNLVDGPGVRDVDVCATNVSECASVLKLLIEGFTTGLDFGVILCPHDDGETLSVALSRFVGAAASGAGSPWTVVASDVWPVDGSADGNLVSAAFDILARILSQERFTYVHLPRALAQSHAQATAPNDHSFAATSTEERIRGIWLLLIGSQKLLLDDNFFSIGGDSLTATQAAARISEAFHIRLSPERLYNHPTIRELARFIDATVQMKAVPLPQTGTVACDAREQLEV